MRRITNVFTNPEMAKVAVRKSLLKEYVTTECERTVYLNNGDEFELQLFNPETFTIAAQISINGEELSNMLVIRPGERVWLERFLDQARRFKFSTYEIEDSDEAKGASRKNGEIVVRFYKEKVNSNKIVSTWTYVPTPTLIREPSPSWLGDNIRYGGATYTTQLNMNLASFDNEAVNYSSAIHEPICSCSVTTYSGEAKYVPAENSASYDRTTSRKLTSSIETGRIEKGNNSSQQLTSVSLDFEDYHYRLEKLVILPTSRKTVNSDDLQKLYCHECGRKLQKKYNYCPFCGEKL